MPIMTATSDAINGIPNSVEVKSTEYGHETVDNILEQTVDGDAKSKHPLVLQCFRLLIADLCQQFGGGHPG